MFSTLRATSRCNLECLHCYSADSGCGKELTTQEIKSAIDVLVDNGVNHITISGGEPFLRSDIFEILKYSSLKTKTGIVCNGTLIDKSAAKALSEIDISRLMISVDGIGAVHDKMRGKDAYSRTEKGIFNSLNYGIPLGASTTLTKLNCNHIMEIYDFLKKNNISRWIIEKLKPVGRAIESDIYIGAKEDDIVMKLLMRLKAEDKNMDISIYDCAHNCSAGIKTISVNPNGDVTPCAFMPQAVCGNILTDSWGAITEKIGGLRLKGSTCF